MGALEKIHVELDWGDKHGFIRRKLPAADSCPQCGARAYRLLDVREECTNEALEPVECIRCVPLSWYARPRGSHSLPSCDAGAESVPSGALARLRAWWRVLVSFARER